MTLGWMLAGLHRRQLPGIVIVFSVTLLSTGYVPGIGDTAYAGNGTLARLGLGSFRWALLYQALLSFVAFPLCLLLGGLWRGRSDREAASSNEAN